MKKEMITLSRMLQGESGKIIEIVGGHGLKSKLDVMGIREGNQVKKISRQYFNGPITVLVENTHTAIGFGMAGKIMVEINRK